VVAADLELLWHVLAKAINRFNHVWQQYTYVQWVPDACVRPRGRGGNTWVCKKAWRSSGGRSSIFAISWAVWALARSCSLRFCWYSASGSSASSMASSSLCLAIILRIAMQARSLSFAEHGSAPCTSCGFPASSIPSTEPPCTMQVSCSKVHQEYKQSCMLANVQFTVGRGGD